MMETIDIETTVNPHTVEGLMEVMKKYVEMTYDGEEMSVPPTWFLMREDGSIGLLPAPFRNDHEKNFYSFLVRNLVSAANIYRLGFVSETWVVDSSMEDVSEDTVPSEHPDRKECFFFVVEDRIGSNLSAKWMIERDEDGKASLGEYEVNKFEHMKGRFANFFEEPPVRVS